jgi:hypothetical protein
MLNFTILYLNYLIYAIYHLIEGISGDARFLSIPGSILDAAPSNNELAREKNKRVTHSIYP